jgi:hypothetical protein
MTWLPVVAGCVWSAGVGSRAHGPVSSARAWVMDSGPECPEKSATRQSVGVDGLAGHEEALEAEAHLVHVEELH